MARTTIIVESETRECLKHTGHKGQTYNELINQLIDMKTKQDSLDSRFGPLPSSESKTK